MKKLLVFLVLVACVAAVAFASLRNEPAKAKKDVKKEVKEEPKKEMKKKKNCMYNYG